MKISIPKLHSIKFKSGVTADNVEHIEHNQDIPVMYVLEGAIIKNLTSVCIFGYTKDGQEYLASSYADPNKSAYLFSRAHLLMDRMVDEQA